MPFGKIKMCYSSVHLASLVHWSCMIIIILYPRMTISIIPAIATIVLIINSYHLKSCPILTTHLSIKETLSHQKLQDIPQVPIRRKYSIQVIPNHQHRQQIKELMMVIIPSHQNMNVHQS